MPHLTFFNDITIEVSVLFCDVCISLMSYYDDLFTCCCSYLPRGHAAADANVDNEDQMAEESSPLGIVPHQVTLPHVITITQCSLLYLKHCVNIASQECVISGVKKYNYICCLS